MSSQVIKTNCQVCQKKDICIKMFDKTECPECYVKILSERLKLWEK